MTIASYQPYDFGLDPEQEARAERLHRDSLIIDLLFQGPLSSADYPARLARDIEARSASGAPAAAVVVDAMFTSGLWAARGELPAFGESWLGCGVTGGNRQIIPEPRELAQHLYGIAQAQFDACDWLIKACKAADFRRAKQTGKAAGFLSTQNGPGATLQDLEDGYNLGLRMVQLTYNTLSAVGAGCTERTDAGLSHFGLKCVDRMNELGIIIDTGHCGRQTTLDACAASQAPVIASHTAAATVFAHDRNKSDEELVAIAATGGVVGLYLCPFFLTSAARPTLEHFLDHVDYLVSLIGPAHLAIGTDWPLCMPAALAARSMAAFAGEAGFRAEHQLDDQAVLAGFTSYQDFPNITRGLVSRGYDDQQVAGILGANALRVFEQVCG